MSSQAPIAVLTKKFGSTVATRNSISHITGLVTRAVTTRQNGDQALVLLSLLPWATTSASQAWRSFASVVGMPASASACLKSTSLTTPPRQLRMLRFLR
ncbi:hypothetical protein D3C84_1162890 [compost metagenome]